MKTRAQVLFFAIVFLSSLSLTAQMTNTWFDVNWNVSSKDKATYYRPNPKPKADGYWIVDYYADGAMQKEGFSLTNITGNEKFDGRVKYYFKTGKLYREIAYKEGKMDGKFSEYFDTGELLETGRYEDNMKTGSWRIFYKNGKIKEKGKYEKGKKIGVWKTYYKNVYK